MKFLSPQFLWFLPLSLLPLLIHWIGSRLRERVSFPWISLLSITESEGRKWRRIFDIILLILRILVLASVILAFSKPVLQKGLPKIDEIYIDVSESMNIHKKALKDLWKRLRDTYPTSPIYAIAEGFMRESDKPVFTHRATDFSALKGAKGANVLLVSDLQRSGFKNLEKLDLNLYLLRFKPIEENVAISGVETDIPYRIPEIPVSLRIHLRNYSDEEVERSLRVIGAKENVEKSVKIGPNGSKILNITIHLKGDHYQVELFPKDSLRGDDIWPGVLSQIETQKVLLVGSKSDLIYIKNALAPIGAKSPFAVETEGTVPPFSHLKLFNVLVLMKAPNPVELGYITEYINKGGALLAFVSGDDFAPLLNLLRIKWRSLDKQVKLEKMEGVDTKLLNQITVNGPIVFEGGTPFIWSNNLSLAITTGEWKVALVGFKPIPDFTDLVFSPLMVPISHRLIFHLLERGFGKNFKVGESPTINVEKVGRYMLRSPKGQKISLLSQIIGGRPRLKIPSLEEIGVYRVENGSVVEIATHLDPIESNLQVAKRDELKEFTSSVKTFPTTFVEGPKELSKPLFLLALLFLLIEISLLFGKALKG